MRKLFGNLFGRTRPPPPPKPKRQFPPVPKWRPAFTPPLDTLVERIHYYANGKKDFVVFEHGTCVVVPNGLTEEDAKTNALDTLSAIFHRHADMNPVAMDDGNILMRYSGPALNVVLCDFARAHWTEIEANHLDAIATDEVLVDAKGRLNVFDENGKMGLYGRCFLFMDAQTKNVVRVERAKP